MARKSRSPARRARSFAGSKNQLVDGALAAVAGSAANKFTGYGGLGPLAVGMYRHNPVLTTIGAMSLTGQLLSTVNVPGLGSLAAPSGGYL